MDISAISNSSIDIQSFLTGVSKSNVSANNGDTKETAKYAEKGEPMYMEEMDTDGDGTVTLDEFRDYCKSKGMGVKEMVKMSQLASTYRTMKAENETIDYISKLIPNIHPNLKQTDSETSPLRSSDNKFNISVDTNNDKMVNYKEYMEYCQQNTVQNQLKSNAAFEEDENGNLRVTNTVKAFESYEKNEEHTLKSTFEELV